MNILDNACLCIGDVGTITIGLRKFDNGVIIEIEDSGCGMSQEQIDKIFDLSLQKNCWRRYRFRDVN